MTSCTLHKPQNSLWLVAGWTCHKPLRVKKALRRAAVMNDGSMTLLCEMEAAINLRPLTYVNTAPSEPEVLTLSHFLVGKHLMSLPDVDSQQDIRYSFWSRWQKKCMLQLGSVHQMTSLSSSVGRALARWVHGCRFDSQTKALAMLGR